MATKDRRTDSPPTHPRPTSDAPDAPDTRDFQRPYTTVDVVIFTVRSDALEVLLVQRPADTNEPFPGLWALPGGFVDVHIDSDLQACARRKLHDKTGVTSPYLEQLGSWGSATRDPRGWSATHAYFALIPARDERLAKGANAADVAWFEVDGMPRNRRLAFDHGQILHAAVERLRSKVEYTSLPAFLLPEPFTLPQLQHTYEVVLGRPIDKSGFRTRMLAAGFLEEVGVVESNSNRPPLGYRLKDRSAPVVFPRTFSPRGG
jgi:8-oxo-dGTP diphosphatase